MALLLQIFFHRRKQFLNVFHLDLAHVRDAEGCVFDWTISASDSHFTLFEEGVQLRNINVALVLDGGHSL